MWLVVSKGDHSWDAAELSAAAATAQRALRFVLEIRTYIWSKLPAGTRQAKSMRSHPDDSLRCLLSVCTRKLYFSSLNTHDDTRVGTFGAYAAARTRGLCEPEESQKVCLLIDSSDGSRSTPPQKLHRNAHMLNVHMHLPLYCLCTLTLFGSRCLESQKTQWSHGPLHHHHFALVSNTKWFSRLLPRSTYIPPRLTSLQP